jgi:hypothetical protein
MLGFIGFVFAIGATLFLSYIYDIFQGPKFRLHLPMASCLALAVVLTLLMFLDPYYLPGISDFTLGNQFLLLPFVILAPHPYVEQWAGIVLQKRYVFFTSVFTADLFVFFHGIPEAGRFLFVEYWQVEGLFWTLCMIVPALVLFLVSFRCQRFFSQKTKDASLSSAPGTEQVITPGLMRFLFVLIAAVVIFWVSLFLAGQLNDVPCGGFDIYSLNQSQTVNRTVIHLNEQDFRNFPRMAPVIRDNKTNLEPCYKARYQNYPCVGAGSFRCNEQEQFHQYRENILEYDDRYYYIIQLTAF